MRAALESSRHKRLGTIQDGHVSEIEHEHIEVSGGRKEDDRRRWPLVSRLYQVPGVD